MINLNKLVKFSIGTLMCFMLACSSCKKPDPTPPSTQYSTLALHIHTYIDTVEIETDLSNLPQKTPDGRKLTLTYASVYLSNFKVVKADGTLYPVKDTVILKTIGNEEYTLGPIPAGNYKSISFDVGIDSPLNHTNPSSYHVTNPLSPKTPNMWFGSTPKGYVFMNVKGMIDSTDGKNSTPNQPFNYQFGSDQFIHTVTLPDQPFTMVPNVPNEVHMLIDYGLLFKGINVKTENNCATFDNPAVAAKISNNIVSMFRYEE